MPESFSLFLVENEEDFAYLMRKSLERAGHQVTVCRTGADALAIRQLMEADAALSEPLHPDLPYIGAEVIWAAREEMACTVDDVLARRMRALFLNAKAAIAMAPSVASLLARELGRDDEWQVGQVDAFGRIARNYRV